MLQAECGTLDAPLTNQPYTLGAPSWRSGMPFRAWNPLAVAEMLFACGGNDGTGPHALTIADLAGNWTVTDWEYSLALDPSHQVDWVDLGLSGSLTIAPNGDFQVTPMLPSGFGVDHGTLSVQGDSIYWNGENDEEWVHFTLTANTLTLPWPEVEVVDMDGDGQPEDVHLRVVLRRS